MEHLRFFSSISENIYTALCMSPHSSPSTGDSQSISKSDPIYWLVTGDWWLVTGDWWLVTGDWWLVTGDWWLVTGDWWLVTGDWWLVTGDWWLVTGDWWLVTGDWWLVTGDLMTGDTQSIATVRVHKLCYVCSDYCETLVLSHWQWTQAINPLLSNNSLQNCTKCVCLPIEVESIILSPLSGVCSHWVLQSYQGKEGRTRQRRG